MLYYLVDGIYPRFAFFVAPYPNPQIREQRTFNRLQEALREDVERLFGILTARFHVMLHPCRLWSVPQMVLTTQTVAIHHNMVVEARRDGFTSRSRSSFTGPMHRAELPYRLALALAVEPRTRQVAATSRRSAPELLGLVGLLGRAGLAPVPGLAPAPAKSTAQASVKVLRVMLEHSGLVGRPGPVAAGRALVPPTARAAAQARLGAPGWGVPGREALKLGVPGRVALGLGVSGRAASWREVPGRAAPWTEVPGREAPWREVPGREVPGREAPGRGALGREARLLLRGVTWGTFMVQQVVHRLLWRPLLWPP